MRWLGDPVTGAALVEGTVASGLVVGGATPTPISGGSGSTNFLYDNNGVFAEGVPTATITIGSAVSGGTASQLLATDGSTNLQNLAVATYPSLTELSYVKGVTSAIQTQLNGKQASGTYLTATTGVTVDQTVGQTIGVTGARLTKLWATDITCTNSIAANITGSSASCTGNAGTATSATSAGTVTGLTFVSGKTLTVDNILEIAGTDSTKMTFPSTSATIARTDAAQTFTGTQTFSQVINTANTVTVSSNAGTVPITSKINNFTNSSASAMTITMATASAVDGQMSIVRIFDYSAASKGITWVNTENSTVTVPPASPGTSTTIPYTVGFIFNGGTQQMDLCSLFLKWQ